MPEGGPACATADRHLHLDHVGESISVCPIAALGLVSGISTGTPIG
jgi:hypothetical protein